MLSYLHYRDDFSIIDYTILEWVGQNDVPYWPNITAFLVDDHVYMFVSLQNLQFVRPFYYKAIRQLR